MRGKFLQIQEDILAVPRLVCRKVRVRSWESFASF